VRLFHGTSEANARKILEEGIKPRGLLDTNGNWEHTVDSNPETVYLTTTYGLYFGLTATEPGERWAVLEIDLDALDESRLVPDEDALEQGTRTIETGEPVDEMEGMKERTEWFRDNIESYSFLWERSAEYLGTVGYKGTIPPEAIKATAFIDPHSAWFRWVVDPCITALNFRLCGEKYRALTEWVFGAEADDELIERFDMFTGHDTDRRTELERFMEDRSAIELERR
jgi:hypothetical protein